MNKKWLIIIISIIAACVALFFVNQIRQKNKETIVDLGDGWKSYSHKDIGITVKIPEDAEVEFKHSKGKGLRRIVDFSDGIISRISTIAQKYLPNESINIDEFRESQKDLNESKDVFIKEFNIDGKVAFIQFIMDKDGEVGFINSVDIVDENRHIMIYFSRKFSGSDNSYFLYNQYPESFYNQYPKLAIIDFSDENMEKVAQDYINLISSAILSIDW